MKKLIIFILNKNGIFNILMIQLFIYLFLNNMSLHLLAISQKRWYNPSSDLENYYLNLENAWHFVSFKKYESSIILIINAALV